MLVDIAELLVQSQESIAALMEMVGGMPKAKRIAVVGGGPMLRLQLNRIMQQSYLRPVADRAAALAWLNREVEPAQAA